MWDATPLREKFLDAVAHRDFDTALNALACLGEYGDVAKERITFESARDMQRIERMGSIFDSGDPADDLTDDGSQPWERNEGND